MLVVHKRILHITSTTLVMCALLSAVYFVGHARDDVPLTFSVLGIGQGDSLLIQGPNDQQILVDAGPDRSILSKLGQYMPFYDHDIELVILSHPHLDHYGGLHEVLNRYTVHRLYITGVVQKSKDYKDLLDQAKAKGVQIEEVWRGKTVDIGADIHLSVLAPITSLHDVKVADLNESSIVAKLSYKQSSFLLTGDATDKEEKSLMATNDDLSADVLKVAHHGSEYSTSNTWLEAVHPKVGVISAGLHNKFGHPNERLLKRFEHHDVQLFRTDLDGDVIFKTDGDTIDVFTTSTSQFSLPGIFPTPTYTIN
ncbi:MAG: MBL fold metallo-hydrolase [Patescibacteria group bacterium]